ncbi:MAG: hypothetical protein AB1400_09095 [Pseudomonadota bacterium]
MQSTQRGNTLIIAAMLTATLVVTAAVALLAYPAASPKGAPFWLSLVALLFAETTLFVFPLYHSRSGNSSKSAAFAFGLGMQTLPLLYAAGVLGVSLLSGLGSQTYEIAGFTLGSPISLAVFHLIWFLLFFLIAAAGKIGAGHVDSLAAERRVQRAGHQQLRQAVETLYSHVSLHPAEACKPLIREIAALREAVQFAAAETLPGTEGHDSDVLNVLRGLHTECQTLGELPEAQHLDRLLSKTREALSLLGLREDAIKAARSTL